MDKPEPISPPQTPPSSGFVAQKDPVPGPWLQLSVPHGFEYNRYRLPIPDLPQALEGFRVLQLSDLHLRPFWSGVYDQLLGRIHREAPDLILVTGDLVNNKRDHTREAPFAHRFVSQLRAPHGVFGVLGNHDQYGLPPKMEGAGITFIERRRHLLDVNGATLELLGLPGVVRKDVTRKVLQSFPPREDHVPRLILSHYPDILRKAEPLRPDVYFAGHTHGGQICLPGGIPVIRHDSLPRRLTKGVHKVKNTWLVVSRGLGFTTLPIRMFCPAEVIEATLVRE
jgi:uncharacterized protein